jgi:hypothetical protein
MIPTTTTHFASAFTGRSTDAGATVGPYIDLYRDSASPADDDLLGAVMFTGEDDGGNTTEYARVAAQVGDMTHPEEDGSILFYTMLAGTLTNTATIASTGSLTLDAGITMGGTTLQLGASATSPTMQVISGGYHLNVRNANANKNLNLDYPSSGGKLQARTGTTAVSEWDESGIFTHNTASGATQDFKIQGDTDADLFATDASADKVGVGIAPGSMRHKFDCRGSHGYEVSKKTANYTLTIDDAIIYADASGLGMGATLTITLPTIAKGRIYEVYRTDVGPGGQSVSVAAPSGTFLNGTNAGTVAIGTQYNGVRIVGIDATDDWIAHELAVPSGGGP